MTGNPFEELQLSIVASLPESLALKLGFKKTDKGALRIDAGALIKPDEIELITTNVKHLGGDYISGPKGAFYWLIENVTASKAAPAPAPASPAPAQPAAQSTPAAAPTPEKEKKQKRVSPAAEFQETFCAVCSDNCEGKPEKVKLCLQVLTLQNYVRISNDIEQIKKQLQKIPTCFVTPNVPQNPSPAPTQQSQPTRSPNPTPAPAAQPAASQGQSVEDVRMMFPEDLDAMLKFEDKPDYVQIVPVQFLGSENFAKIANTVRGLGGEYISAGRDSHFRVYKRRGPASSPAPAAQPAASQGHFDGGILWKNDKNQREEPFEKATETDNAQSQAYFALKERIIAKVNAGKKGIAEGGKWHWLGQDGDWIGRKPQKQFPSRR